MEIGKNVDFIDTMCYIACIDKGNDMKLNLIRVRLPEELMKKYKVFCAISDMSMTQMTEHIVRDYIKSQNEIIKIIKIEKK